MLLEDGRLRRWELSSLGPAPTRSPAGEDLGGKGGEPALALGRGLPHRGPFPNLHSHLFRPQSTTTER